MINSIAFESPNIPDVEVASIQVGERHIPDVCHHYPNGIDDDAHIDICDADFVLVGEAPGANEAQLGRPFVGASEAKLRDWWRPYGITRSQAYITNVYPFRPSNKSNDIGLVDRSRIAEYVEILRRKIARCRPGVVVPTGNTALRALLGDEKSITDWRGSIIPFVREDGRVLKVIPTFHPASTFRRPILAKFCEADWQKVASELHTPYQEVYKEHIIDPDEADVNHFIAGLKVPWRGASNIPTLAIDIENQYWKTEPGNITCIGFAYSPYLSLTIPTHRRDLGGDAKLIERNWGWVRTLCEWDIDKILQNGLYDQYHMVRKANIWFTRYNWDLMEMDHCLNPNEGGAGESGEELDGGMKIEMRSLAVLTSLYTKQPFYKYMASDPNPDNRLIYNGLDACVTREIFDPLWCKLRERGMV